VNLDLAALARSLRLPPSALRIVDLSALALQETREAEASRLAEEAGELPPRLRVRVEEVEPSPPWPPSPTSPSPALGEGGTAFQGRVGAPLSRGGGWGGGRGDGGEGSLDWLVFAPETPQKAPEKVYTSAVDYWDDRLPGLPPPPALPLTAPAAPLRRRLSELDAETWGELRARASWEGLAPASLLLAALADALAAWSLEPRFTVALSLTGTPGGLWVPLEMDGAAPGAFDERARGVQERLRRDLAWPLPRSLEPEGLPELPVAVALPPRLLREGTERDEGDESGRTGRGRTATRLLRLQVAERESGLLLIWDVSEPSFPEGMADALIVAFRDLLRRLSAGPAWKEVRRRLIPPQQLARMVAFNTTGAPLPEPFLHELFAVRARRQPDRVAVTGPRGSATYGELLRASDRLGHLLQREGARRNTPVAVVLEPGWEAVAALLGVLAAGAAYLPVDPGTERFRSVLEHGRIELAVTREALADTLDWPEEIVGVMVEDLEAAGLPDGPPAVPSASPKDLACVLFGPDAPVMLENRGVANLAMDLVHRFGIGPADRTLALSPLSEGPSLFEIFGTLAAGGTVVFDTLAGAEGITVAAAPDRVVLKGGRTAVLRGSLETTVWTAVSEDGSSFGRPISNQSVHVLDGRLELCPFWVPGDLYVGGIGLARGYWRDPARSAERFAIHPDTGERLFRTGLRARWLPGGEIELLTPPAAP